jgi:hypothetical protein
MTMEDWNNSQKPKNDNEMNKEVIELKDENEMQ